MPGHIPRAQRGHTRKTRTLLLSSALLLGACGRGPASEFEAGVPTAENVKIDVPASGSQGLTASGVRAQGQGEESELYRMTHGVTGAVNFWTAAVLHLVRDITRHPPTTMTETQAVWGPHTEPLSKITWKLTVNRVGDGVHDYKLEGKDKTKDDSTYVTVLSGTHTTAKDATTGEALEDYGSGTFTIDWDARAQIPDHNATEMGKGTFTYSRLAPGSQVTVAVDFQQVRDAESGQRIDVDYGYAANPGEGGTFDFAVLKNMDAQAQLERISIRSRWQETGAGRADVKFSGGDMGAATATINECWDSNFLSRYVLLSATTTEWNLSYGTEANDCAIQGASYFEG